MSAWIAGDRIREEAEIFGEFSASATLLHVSPAALFQEYLELTSEKPFREAYSNPSLPACTCSSNFIRLIP